MDIFMLVMIIVLAIILLVISIYLLAHYCHPDDNGWGTGTFCKIIAVLSLAIAWSQILLLPLDVSNTRGSGGGFRMDLVWEIIYIILACFVFFVIPLITYFYECDPSSTCCQKIMNTFCSFIVQTVAVILIFGLSFIWLSTADIPITSIVCSLVVDESNSPIDVSKSKCVHKETSMEINVSFVIYAIGLLSFISNFFLCIFGGIGFFALPLDMVYSFCTRPIKMSPTKIEELKKDIVETVVDLKELGLHIKTLEKEGVANRPFWNRDKKVYNKMVKKFKMGVAIVDEQFETINVQNIIANNSAVKYYCNLILGILLFIVSIVWILHIILYVVIKIDNQPVSQFINVILVILTEQNVSFVAIGIFALLCLYLLLCTIKGNFKFGIRFILLGSIHPMKKNATYMNSILFNIMLVMITSVSVNQFCVKAFNEYACMTEIDIIFSTQINYLRFFIYFFDNNIFEYILLGVIVISFFYLICRPSDTKTMKAILYRQIERNKQKEVSAQLIELTDIKN